MNPAKMNFDWYQATINADPVLVLQTIAKLGHELRPNDGIARMYRYNQGYQVHHTNLGIVANVVFGGNGGNAHAWATSDHAPEFSNLVRTEWPDKHLVTRLDTAADFVEEGSYETLRKVCKKVAKGHRLKFAQQADELNKFAGRTQYMGSPTSDYRSRLYEKGFQVLGQLPQIAKGQISVESVTSYQDMDGNVFNPAHWTRLELQVRPKHEEGKCKAAYASPEEAWFFSEWTSELAKAALLLDMERYYIRSKKQSTDEKAFKAMCGQYRNVLMRLRQDLGSWECLGLTIEEALKEIAKNAKNFH